MLKKVKQWLLDNLIETDCQNLTKELKWVSQDDLISKGFAFRRRKSFIDEKCHTYHDSATYFKIGKDGNPNDYHVVSVKVWAERKISFVKCTPKLLRNLLSFKKSYIYVTYSYNNKLCEEVAPYYDCGLEFSWLRYKYSKIFYKHIEELVNGL